MSLNKRLMSSQPAPFVASENFKVVTWTGNGSSQTITVGFKPDFVWGKERSNTSSHELQDSTRGATKYLMSSATNAEATSGQGLQSFTATGFTVGNDGAWNQNNETYVAWCWKAGGGTTSSNTDGNVNTTVQVNEDAGFSIIKTANSDFNESRTFGHGLGNVGNGIPDFFIIKPLSKTFEWRVYTSANSYAGFNKLDSGDAKTNVTTNVTSSTFNTQWTPANSSYESEWIMYAFKAIDGFSSFGSYTGNGSANGPIVETGFEPAFVMIKRTDGTQWWLIFDNKRNTTNPRNKLLYANENNADDTTTSNPINFYSNGFQPVGTGASVNTNNGSYIYMAFAADPDTEAPTLASSFNIETWAGNARDNTAILGTGFKPDMVWYKTRTAANDHNLSDSIRGATFQVRSNRDIAQVNATDQIKSFDSDGLTLGTGGDANANGQTYVAWSWKADDNEPTINTEGTNTDSVVSVNSAAGFSIVQFTSASTFSGSNTVGHGLSAAPNMILVKATSTTEDWYVYHSAMGLNKAMRLNSTIAMANATYLFGTVNSTVFNYNYTSTSPITNIAYCFHDVAGYQKFGGYTGNGNNDRAITTGFKPDFVLIKSTVGNDNWRLYDTRRGIEDGGYLEPNRSDTDDTTASPNLTMTSTGFTITSGGVTAGNNANGNLYIYWAIAKNVPSNTTLANSFKIVTWSGNNSARTISGMGFNPDLLWIKARNASEQHYLYDKLRGASKFVHSNITAAEGTDTSSRLRDFTADGFKLGTDAAINGNNNTYIAWGWKAGNNWESNVDGSIPTLVNANTANGFSVIKYDMNITSQTAFTIGHGLSSAPELVIFFSLDQSGSTSNIVYPNSPTKEIAIDSDGAGGSSSNYWNNTAPSTTVINMGTAWGQYSSYYGGDTVAYAFHSVSGYSKIGNYTGNGSANNAITGVGFQPDWVMLKNVTDGSTGWQIFDSARTNGYVINANANSAESDDSAYWGQFDSDGFTVQQDNTTNNKNGSTYLYMAFKEN